MKRIILFVLIVFLCLTACGGAVFGEVDQSAEELWKALGELKSSNRTFAF